MKLYCVLDELHPCPAGCLVGATTGTQPMGISRGCAMVTEKVLTSAGRPRRRKVGHRDLLRYPTDVEMLTMT